MFQSLAPRGASDLEPLWLRIQHYQPSCRQKLTETVKDIVQCNRDSVVKSVKSLSLDAIHMRYPQDVIIKLRRMPGSGLHRQLWRNHRLEVNIWNTGRGHIQGKGASHFAQLLVNAKDISVHSDPQPQLSPVLSESPPVCGSDLPGQAGSPILSIADSVFGILPVCLRFRVSVMFAQFCCFMGVFWVLSFGICGFPHFMYSWPRDEVVAQVPFSSEMEPTQAQAHQRNRLSGLITARSKKPPFSPRFQGAFFFGSGACFSMAETFPGHFSTFPNFQAEIRGMAGHRPIARHHSDDIFGSGAIDVFHSQRASGTFLGGAEALSEVFISLWSSPFAVSMSHFPCIVAAPFPRICFWGLLCLCWLSCIFGLRHVLGRCCVSLASRVSSRSRFLRFSWLGATIAVILVLWQMSFFGIRVGEAANPGPTMSNSVPASDGVTTPVPQFQDQDLEISAPGLLSRPPDSVPVAALSLSPVSMCLCPSPAGSLCAFLPFQFLLPAWFWCPPLFQPGPHCPSSQPFSSSSFRSLCVRSVFVPSSFTFPRQALLPGPLLPRPCSPLSRVGHLRLHALTHRCSPRGAAPW